MRPKDSCPVWREDAGKVPNGNSPTSYSTARRDLWGRCRLTGTSTRQVVLGSVPQLLGNRTQHHGPPPDDRATKSAAGLESRQRQKFATGPIGWPSFRSPT